MTGNLKRFTVPHIVRNPLSADDIDENFNALERRLNEVIDVANDPLDLQWRPPSYDSALVAVPDTITSVTAVDTWVDGIVLFNTTTQLRHFTLKDGNDVVYLNEMPVQPAVPTSIPLYAMLFANGIKWQVRTGQSGLKAQIVGNQ